VLEEHSLQNIGENKHTSETGTCLAILWVEILRRSTSRPSRGSLEIPQPVKSKVFKVGAGGGSPRPQLLRGPGQKEQNKRHADHSCIASQRHCTTGGVIDNFQRDHHVAQSTDALTCESPPIFLEPVRDELRKSQGYFHILSASTPRISWPSGGKF